MLNSKISTDSTTSAVRNSSDSTLARSLFRGTVSSDNPVMGFYTYAASATSTNNYIQISFDGTNFYAKGQKGGAGAVTKKLGSYGTATTAQVLTGKTFSNDSNINLTGTMANRGAWTSTPTTSSKVTIPAGYHNGSGYVDTSTVYNNGVAAGKAANSDVKHTVTAKLYYKNSGGSSIYFYTYLYVDGVHVATSSMHNFYSMDGDNFYCAVSKTV